MAEGVGFEPTEPFQVRRFSSSATAFLVTGWPLQE